MTISEVLTRQVDEVLPSRKGLESLMKKKKIRLYLGIDPTGRNLHLGHTIALRKLQQFAQLGHEAILVVGTGTVLAGDPSQRAEARPTITEDEVKENMKEWKKQASKVLDFSKVTMKINGEWLLKLKLPDILRIASNISASQLFQRDMFQTRLAKGDTVWTHELLYPLLQGYDSVHMDVDLEIGGTDQIFNMLVGRELQKKMNSHEKYVLTVPMLLGLDGKTMSKSSGNTVNIQDSPEEMYGKIMSMQDELIPQYVEMVTEMPMAKMKGLSPRDAKGLLAKDIVSQFHGEKKAEQAEQEFTRVFRKKELPTQIPTVMPKGLSVGQKVATAELLMQAHLASSKSEARRLIEQGGVYVDGERAGQEIMYKKGMILQVGKRKFIKIGAR